MGQGTFKCDWPDDPKKCVQCNYPRDLYECEEGVMLCKICEGMGFRYRDKAGNFVTHEEHVKLRGNK